MILVEDIIVGYSLEVESHVNGAGLYRDDVVCQESLDREDGHILVGKEVQTSQRSTIHLGLVIQ